MCREHDVPVLSRGGGTSLAGQCCNAAVVIDWSKYCTRIVSVDEDARTCVVEPGIKLDDLNAALPGPPDLRPEARDARQLHARRDDRQQLLRVDRADVRQGRRQRPPPRGAHLRRPADVGRADVRGRVRRHPGRGRAPRARSTGGCGRSPPTTPRWWPSASPTSRAACRATTSTTCVPGSGFDLARALVGSESTLVTVLHAELDLVVEARHTGAGGARVPRHRRVRALRRRDPAAPAALPGVHRPRHRRVPARQGRPPARDGRDARGPELADGRDPRRRPRAGRRARAGAGRRPGRPPRRPVRPHRHRPGRAGRALRHPGVRPARLGARPAHRAGQLRGLGGRGAADRPARGLPARSGSPCSRSTATARAPRSTGTSATAASTRASRSSSARRPASRPTARSWSARRTCA